MRSDDVESRTRIGIVYYRHQGTADEDVSAIAAAEADGIRPGGVALAEPERRLMLALLTDAIVTFRKPLADARRDEQRLLEETERWIRSDDRAWPCSFVNVCEAIGIEPEPLRRAVLRGKAAPTANATRTTRRCLLAGNAARTRDDRRRPRR
jgi:hypothetical protein